jgi:tetratricopeptide (TPR) repeat protein
MSKDSKATKQKGKLLSFIPTAEYYFSKGIKAYHRRDFHKAKKYFQRALQLEPGEPMITCQLAVLLTEIGDFQQSNRLLHTVIEELDPDMVECHYFLANNYAHLGLFKDAYHHANLYMQVDPTGEFTEETEDLLELLSLEADEDEEEFYEQDDLIVQQEQARELLESGHFPKAIEVLNTVIKNYPEYWSAYNNLALAYFYLGEVDKAFKILHDVLHRNPGNLHAMCNRLVFSFYQRDRKEVRKLKAVLEKVQPISYEHQFKLGTTFALVGEYELAYGWLRKLHKQGFEGDGPFYYWLSYSCYHTGREQAARTIWKKVLELNPGKAGSEPWNEERQSDTDMEHHLTSILKKYESQYIEERLFAMFLTSVSSKKEEILASPQLKNNGKFSSLEREYLKLLKAGENPADFAGHVTAESLYEHHHPVGVAEASLFLMWFMVFVELVKVGYPLKNEKAWAAAIEYEWARKRNQKITQAAVAEHYQLSTATVQKYVKIVKNFLN